MAYYVSSGQVSSGIILNDDWMEVYGTANSTTVNSLGWLYVSSGGTAADTTVNGGYMWVVDGGTATGATVTSSGGIYVSNGGRLADTTVTSSGCVVVSSIGSLSNTMVSSGGSVFVDSGGTHTGSLDISGGYFYVSSGGVVDFDISAKTPVSDVLVSDLSRLSGYPSFTVTMSSSQPAGQYRLAAGTSSFSGSVSVTTDLGDVLGTVSIGSNLTVGSLVYSLVVNSGILTFQIGTEADAPAEDTLLPYTLPQAEYMYGCVATAAGMLLGYYDLYGYTFNGQHYGFSNLIEGTVSVDSRGSDSGSIYDMSDPSVLANFIASTGYVSRFYDQTPEHELPYSYVNGDPGQGLNVSVWDCLADYLGTGQYWRGNDDLSTCYYSANLDYMLNHDFTEQVQPGFVIPARENDFKYGLYLYTQERGYPLDTEATRTVEIEDFPFSQFMAEIDAGRPVLLSMQAPGGYGHMIIAYGYNSETQEVIFDDTYRTGCRMAWNGTYNYGGNDYSLSAASLVVFGQPALPPEPIAHLVETYSGGELVSAADAMTGKTLVYGGTEDLMLISSGGTANETTVNSGGSMIVSGMANSTTVNSNGRMYVSSGGTTNSTTVNSGGMMSIRGGGIAAGIVENGGYVDVAEGANVTFTPNAFSGLVLSDWQSATVHSGTTAVSTTVNSGGRMSVSSGGKVTGNLEISSGAIVSAYDGSIIDFDISARTADSPALVNDLSLISGTPDYTITVSADQTAGVYTLAGGADGFTGMLSIGTEGSNYGTITVNGAALTYGDYTFRLIQENDDLELMVGNPSTLIVSDLFFSDGGTYDQVIVLSHFPGGFSVTGGTANHTDLYGDMYVTGNSNIYHTVVHSGGWLDIGYSRSGETAGNRGTADGITVRSGGILRFCGDGEDNTIRTGETVTVSITNVIVEAGGSINGFKFDHDVVFDDAVHDVVISDGTVGTVESATVVKGWTVSNITVESYGSLGVHKGGSATNITVHAGGDINGFSFGDETVVIADASHLSHVITYYGGVVYAGQTVTDVGVVSEGWLTVYEGGSVTDIIIDSCGELYVNEGGSATNITVLASGTINGFNFGDGTVVLSDASSFSNAMVEDWASVYAGQTAANITVESGGWLNVYEGGTATGITVKADGTINGFSFGDETVIIADASNLSNVTVSNYFANVYAGQTAKNVTVGSDSSLSVASGGKVTGTFQITSGAMVSASEGGIIDFDITARTTASPALVNDLSLIQGTPDFTVTVSDTQTAGVYTLAGGAAGSSGTFSIGTDGVNYGTITVNGDALEHGTQTFTLATSGDSLLLTVEGEAVELPEVLSVTADITAATNQKVTVTATFNETSVTRQYSLDNTNWQAYRAGIPMFTNGTAYFRGIDAVGNISEVTSYTVDNIEIPDNTYTVTNADDGKVDLAYSGKYRLGGAYGDITGSVTVLNGGKKIGTGTLKNGVLTFNKGNPILLDNSLATELQVTVKAGTDTNYTAVLSPEKVFDKGDADSLSEPGGLGLIAEPGPLVEDGWVGYGDEFDYLAFTLDHAANLIFDYTASDAAKFTVCQMQPGGKLKTLQTTTLKAGAEASGKALLLNAGDYYLTVQSTNAKKGGDADYTVTVNDNSVFFTKGDTTDDTLATAKYLGTVTDAGNLFEDWVGFGDEVDFRKVTLDSAAKLQFTVNSGDAVKFTVYQLDAKGKQKALGNVSVKAGASAKTKDLFVEAGTYYLSVQSTNAKKGGDADYTVAVNDKSVFFTKGDKSDDTMATAKDLGTVTDAGNLFEDWVGFGDEVDFRKVTLDSAAKLQFTVNSGDAVKFTVYQLNNGKLKALQNVSLKAGQELKTKDLFVEAGTYYLSVQSTNAKKGGDADYSIALNDSTKFFAQGDNTNDTWKAAQAQAAKLQGEEITGWVGYSDAADFIKFQVEEDGKLELDLDQATADAMAAKQIKLTCLDAKGKSVALSILDSDTLVSKKAVAAGEYYLGVSCTNVKKFDTSYSITAGLLAAV